MSWWTRELGLLMSTRHCLSSWTTSKSWTLTSSTRFLELCKAPSASRSRPPRKAWTWTKLSTRTNPKTPACQSSQIRVSNQEPQTDKFRPPSISFSRTDLERFSTTTLNLMMKPRLSHRPKTSRGRLGSPTERETWLLLIIYWLTIRTLN